MQVEKRNIAMLFENPVPEKEVVEWLGDKIWGHF